MLSPPAIRGAALTVELDVTQPRQRMTAVQEAEAHLEAIDVLINNAGIDYVGAIEEQREEDYRAQFEVNFFAAVSMIRLVLPGMRRRQCGTIVKMSSMDGIASLPANGYYSASKFALEGPTEALWQEIEPIGLRAFLVEPGSLRTWIRKLVTTASPDLFPGDPVRAAAAIYEVVVSGVSPALGHPRK